jgi:hypothetical protein
MNASEMIRRLQVENQALREEIADALRQNAALRPLNPDIGEQVSRR